VNRALRAATVGVLLLSPVVLSACGAGQTPQTSLEQRDKVGAMAKVGDISLREVTLAYPDGGSYAAGSDAELQMAIVNDGGQDDTLTGITGQGFSGAVFTDASSAAALTAPKASATPTPAPTSATSTAAATGASATAGVTASATPAASAAPTTPATTPPPTELAIPAGQSVFVGTGTTHITLTGLQSTLTTGQFLTLTLSFQKAGDVTVKATVANPPTPLSHSDAYNFDQSNGG
jgi:copper(I)-binding protein